MTVLAEPSVSMQVLLQIFGITLAVVLGFLSAWIAYQNRRHVDKNDQEHQELRTDIKELVRGQQQLAQRISDVAEDRPRRKEVNAHYASLVQRIGDVGERISELKGAFEAGRQNGSTQ